MAGCTCHGPVFTGGFCSPFPGIFCLPFLSLFLLIFFALSYLVQYDPERVGSGVLVQSLLWAYIAQVSVLTSPETAPSSGTQRHS